MIEEDWPREKRGTLPRRTWRIGRSEYSSALLSKTLSNRRYELFGIDRFTQHAWNFQVLEIHAAAGDDDDRDVSCVGVRRDFLMHDQSAHGRKRQIENDQVRRLVVDPIERRCAVRGLFDRKPRDHQRRPKHSPQIIIVLNDEDDLACRRAKHKGILLDWMHRKAQLWNSMSEGPGGATNVTDGRLPENFFSYARSHSSAKAAARSRGTSAQTLPPNPAPKLRAANAPP